MPITQGQNRGGIGQTLPTAAAASHCHDCRSKVVQRLRVLAAQGIQAGNIAGSSCGALQGNSSNNISQAKVQERPYHSLLRPAAISCEPQQNLASAPPTNHPPPARLLQVPALRRPGGQQHAVDHHPQRQQHHQQQAQPGEHAEKAKRESAVLPCRWAPCWEGRGARQLMPGWRAMAPQLHLATAPCSTVLLFDPGPCTLSNLPHPGSPLCWQ